MKRPTTPSRPWKSVFFGLCLATLPQSSGFAGESDEPEKLEFFESRIRPVLVEHCYRCHNSERKAKAGIALDSRDGVRKDDGFGAAVVPGKPQSSLLLAAIRHETEGSEMPDEGPKLSDAIIVDFEQWIRDGATDPRDHPPSAEALEELTSWAALLQKRSQWWSFQPIRNPVPPTGSGWSDHPLDRFVEARLEEHGLKPAATADRHSLLRRLSFTLTGLPPSVREIDQYLADESPAAVSLAIDRLLASPQFGERWARHWMDVVRYADSHGSEGDPSIPGAYQYRDYLIRALNADVPYDQLLREHVAGDLLPEPRYDEELGIDESAIGSAHWRLVFHGFAPTDALDEKVRFTDDQINVFGKAFQGLTISCARCHNHKFDAIGQKDYYALFGVLASCRPAMQDVNTPQRQSMYRNELEQLKGEIRTGLGEVWLAQLPSLASRLGGTDSNLVEAFAAADKPQHALFALAQTGRLVDQGGSFETAWQKQVDAFRAEEQALGRDDEIAGLGDWDLSGTEGADSWFFAGNGLNDRPSPAGEFAIEAEGSQVLTGIYPSGIYTHLLSSRHRGVLSSPGLALESEANVWFRLLGGGQATVRFVVQNYPRSGTVYPINEIKAGDWKWHRSDMAYWVGDRVHFELATARDAPLEVRNQDRSWFGIRRVMVRPRESGAPPERAWESAAALFQVAASRKPASRQELVDCAAEALRAAIESWRSGTATDAQALFLNAWLQTGLLLNAVEELPRLAGTIADYREMEGMIPLPTRVPGVAEAEVRDQPLFERGDHRKPLEPVRRRFLEAFDSRAYPSRQSGRLELAEDLLSGSNPLTARVIVNRIWTHMFGRGIVATPDNFGSLGSLPSHPELLDFLSSRMVLNGWSIKDTIRFILGSKTWQLESRPSARAREIDPENIWLSHANVRRLDAESIRDSLVFVSGGLDPRPYGPGFGANGSGKRRSVYILSRRNSLDEFLQIFNSPVPFAPVGKRSTTNVPAQSLALMNDPFVLALARDWGAAVRSSSDLDTDPGRITRMFVQGLGRPPLGFELDALVRYADSCSRAIEGAATRREECLAAIQTREQQLQEILAPARERLLEHPRDSDASAAGPAPIARWDFREGLNDTLGALHAVLHGNARLEAGGLLLDGSSHASTAPLEREIREKTLEAWVRLATYEQAGGAVVTIQDLQGNQFDSIVFSERIPRRWMAGSDNFRRTSDFGAPDELQATGAPVHLAITYAADGTIRGYRQGQPYGAPYRKAALVTYPAGNSQMLFGLRHGSPQSARLLRGTIIEARLYDRALSEQEIAASAQGRGYVSQEEIMASLEQQQRDQVQRLQAELEALRAELPEFGDPVPPSEVWTRVAHALFNLKEFTYLR